jgi:hypothetical protein
MCRVFGKDAASACGHGAREAERAGDREVARADVLRLAVWVRQVPHGLAQLRLQEAASVAELALDTFGALAAQARVRDAVAADFDASLLQAA